MLNIQINHDGVKIESNGKMMDLLGEITYVIHNIHSSLDSHDPEMASAFRSGITEAITDHRSPVWKPCKHDGTGIVIVSPAGDC